VAAPSTPATTYTVTVTNTGDVEGDEVVLAYVTPKPETLRASLGAGTPIEKKRLFGFQRVTLKAGASTDVSFDLAPSHLAMVGSDGHTALHPGEFDIVFSRGHGNEISAKAAVAPTSARAVRTKHLRKWW